MNAPGIDPRVLDALQSACSLELFQLSTQIERLLADPRRIIAVRKDMHLGQTMRFVWTGAMAVCARPRSWPCARHRSPCRICRNARNGSCPTSRSNHHSPILRHIPKRWRLSRPLHLDQRATTSDVAKDCLRGQVPADRRGHHSAHQQPDRHYRHWRRHPLARRLRPAAPRRGRLTASRPPRQGGVEATLTHGTCQQQVIDITLGPKNRIYRPVLRLDRKSVV